MSSIVNKFKEAIHSDKPRGSEDDDIQASSRTEPRSNPDVGLTGTAAATDPLRGSRVTGDDAGLGHAGRTTAMPSTRDDAFESKPMGTDNPLTGFSEGGHQRKESSLPETALPLQDTSATRGSSDPSPLTGMPTATHGTSGLADTGESHGRQPRTKITDDSEEPFGGSSRPSRRTEPQADFSISSIGGPGSSDMGTAIQPETYRGPGIDLGGTGSSGLETSLQPETYTGTMPSKTTDSHHDAVGQTDTAAGGVLHGTGPAPNTAGPHKSDMMNKMDPRVDSDLDNSKTIGGDKTFSQP